MTSYNISFNVKNLPYVTKINRLLYDFYALSKPVDMKQKSKEVYQEIVNEWLQGSSRDNEKIISEVELLYGIEAIAFYMMSHVSDE